MATRAKLSADQTSLFGSVGDASKARESSDAVAHGNAATTRKSVKVLMYCDGGSRGNPGPSAIGAVVYDATTHDELVLAEVSECIGVATNNVAEYKAMLAGLDAALDLGATEITVRADSKLLIEQLKGNYKVKHPNLQPLCADALKKIKRFDRVVLEHVRREYNTVADALANRAMDAEERRH